MTSSDPSVTAAVAAAQDRIRAVVDGAIVEVANALLFQMKAAGTYRERGQLAFAQIHILESRELFLSSFATALRDRVSEDIAARSERQAGRRSPPTGSRSASSTKARSRKGSRSSGSAS